jgi:NAD(P)-dependent dehydrogenase (short-subunit alcohol dehydrogenase family)
MKDLDGKVAAITGAASGLGLAMAQTFAEHGMRLALADVDAAALTAVAEEFRAAGHEVVAVPVDVADPDSVQQFADTTFDTFGAVHVLCNNAGVVKRARTWELTLDDWNWVIGVDLWGVIHGVRAFVPRMVEQGVGHVVNTSSMAGLLPIPNLGAYAAAKSAVLGLSLSMQTEFDQMGGALQVSLLAPGFIATAITNSARNRPDRLGTEAAPPAGPRTSAAVVPTMTADDVAQQVLDAVLHERFWILTHDRYRAVITEHAAGIGTDARPVAAPIW